MANIAYVRFGITCLLQWNTSMKAKIIQVLPLLRYLINRNRPKLLIADFFGEELLLYPDT